MPTCAPPRSCTAATVGFTRPTPAWISPLLEFGTIPHAAQTGGPNANLVMAGGSASCTSDPPSVPLGGIPAQLPALPAPVTGTGYTDVAGCRVFRPGTYTFTPNLAGNNYFKSGVYNFVNV